MTNNDQRIIDALRAANIDYDADNFSPNYSFKENGIDSLDVMSLFLEVEETYGLKFPAAEAATIKTPAELSLALDRNLK